RVRPRRTTAAAAVRVLAGWRRERSGFGFVRGHFRNERDTHAKTCLTLSWYHGTYIPLSAEKEAAMIEVERVQTGVRMEKRLLKVLKAFAELKDITLGDLLEGIVLHAFEGKAPFGKESTAQIAELKKIYGLTLKASDSHKLKEKE